MDLDGIENFQDPSDFSKRESHLPNLPFILHTLPPYQPTLHDDPSAFGLTTPFTGMSLLKKPRYLINYL